MTSYEFESVWRFDAPLSKIWEALCHPESWPTWWRAVQAVEDLKRGDPHGVGALRRYTWRGVIPYSLTFDMRTTVVVPQSRLEGEACGDLHGTGRWQFSTEDGSTVVRYEWTVAVRKPWISVLSPLARPLFEWNHDVVMRWGQEGLSKWVAGPGDPAPRLRDLSQA